MDVAKLLQRVPLPTNGAPVGGEQFLDDRSRVFPIRSWHDEILNRHDQWRICDDPKLAVDLTSPLGEHSNVVACLSLRHAPLGGPQLLLGQAFLLGFLVGQLQQHARIELVIPGTESSQLGRMAHPLPIFAHSSHHDRTPVSGGEAPITSHDLEAGGEPLDVPLPRARQGLIEVVDVEEHPALRRAEEAEV
jgi:hypothetical protein